MSMIKPRRWTPRSLLSVLMPHLFRKIRSPQELLGAYRSEKVPLDADTYHLFKKQKLKDFAKSVLHMYGLDRQPDKTYPKKLWCVLAGTWVPEHSLTATHIFPPELGPTLEMEILGSSALWQAQNGLMLPRRIGPALYDWALVIVPSEPGSRALIRDYKVKILEPEYPYLQALLHPTEKKSGLKGTDLDDRQITFRHGARPMHQVIYFHCCCAIWKKTCLENPEVTDRDVFWELFLENMKELWGASIRLDKLGEITNVFLPRKEGMNKEEELRDIRKSLEV